MKRKIVERLMRRINKEDKGQLEIYDFICKKQAKTFS